MTAWIKSTAYCLCGGGMEVESLSWEDIKVWRTGFFEVHSGPDHRLFPTKAAVAEARGQVRPVRGEEGDG